MCDSCMKDKHVLERVRIVRSFLIIERLRFEYIKHKIIIFILWNSVIYLFIIIIIIIGALLIHHLTQIGHCLFCICDISG